MGTRNLTCVVKNGEYVVAQYGQWDGYPSGVGLTILEALKIFGVESIVKNVDKAFFIDDDFLAEMRKTLNIKSNDGWITSEESDRIEKFYPTLHRNTGGDIIELIQRSKANSIPLKNSLDFAKDSLFCEWAYVIDLDKETFEVYEGFNTNKLEENERFFFDGEINKQGYYPVKLLISYNLNDLPEEELFLSQTESEDEE